jgi:hypothetical protein
VHVGAAFVRVALEHVVFDVSSPNCAGTVTVSGPTEASLALVTVRTVVAPGDSNAPLASVGDAGAMLRGLLGVPVRSAVAVPPGVPATSSVACWTPTVPTLGAKCAVTVQVCVVVSVCPVHPSVPIANWPTLAPPSEVASVPDVTPPPFFTVNVTSAPGVPCGVLGNCSLAGVSVSVADVAAVPVRLDVVVPPGVPVTESVASCIPRVPFEGANVTLIVQLLPAPSGLPLHASGPMPNWVAFVPVSVACSVPEATPPPFVTTNGIVPLVLPCATVPMAWLVGEIVMLAWAIVVAVSVAAVVPPGVPAI